MQTFVRNIRAVYRILREINQSGDICYPIYHHDVGMGL